MIILAIEASAKTASAAVMEAGVILSEASVNGTLTHSETLMPMVSQVLEQAGKQPAEIEVIAFTNGPGSFTGLRIGAAAAKGMAYGLKKPLFAVSTLEVLGYGCVLSKGYIVPLMDARRHQVYTAVYYSDGKNLTEKRAPEAMDPQALAVWLKEVVGDETVTITGDGAKLYQEVFNEVLGDKVILSPAFQRNQQAGVTAALTEKKLAEGAALISSEELTIDYLRKPQAEREREARMSEKHG